MQPCVETWSTSGRRMSGAHSVSLARRGNDFLDPWCRLGAGSSQASVQRFMDYEADGSVVLPQDTAT